MCDLCSVLSISCSFASLPPLWLCHLWLLAQRSATGGGGGGSDSKSDSGLACVSPAGRGGLPGQVLDSNSGHTWAAVQHHGQLCNLIRNKKVDLRSRPRIHHSCAVHTPWAAALQEDRFARHGDDVVGVAPDDEASGVVECVAVRVDKHLRGGSAEVVWCVKPPHGQHPSYEAVAVRVGHKSCLKPLHT